MNNMNYYFVLNQYVKYDEKHFPVLPNKEHLYTFDTISILINSINDNDMIAIYKVTDNWVDIINTINKSELIKMLNDINKLMSLEEITFYHISDNDNLKIITPQKPVVECKIEGIYMTDKKHIHKWAAIINKQHKCVYEIKIKANEIIRYNDDEWGTEFNKITALEAAIDMTLLHELRTPEIIVQKDITPATSYQIKYNKSKCIWEIK